MRRRLLLGSILAGGTLGVLLGLSAAAGASPADPTPRTITQPDGATFVGRMFGDEYLNGLETEAGFTVVQRADGTWTFARQANGGRLVATGLLPDADGRPPASTELAPHLRDEVAAAEADEERAESAEGSGGPTPPAIGTQPVLVVLVQFADESLSTTAADWASLFFGPSESVRDFYSEASGGQLDLSPAAETQGTMDDGVVTVTLPVDHPNSGRNFFEFQAIAADIVEATDGTVDFAAYDTAGNGDGFLSPDELHLAIVVAGGEAAQGCAAPTVWGHRSEFGPVTLDGVDVGDGDHNGGYFAAGELQNNTAGTACDEQGTLGIHVHELGHDLGWIDLYDTDESSGGVDTWSVMAIHWLALDGARSGSSPPLPDPFSRSQVGWVDPPQITVDTADHALAPTGTGGAPIRLGPNPGGVDVDFLGGGGTGDYFLVENRQHLGYDEAVAGCGALVWHIDESQGFNGDDDARRVDVEEAGGGASQSGFADADDPYPSENPPNAVFNATSSPDSLGNGGLPSGVALSDIQGDCGQPVTLDIDPNAPTPRPFYDRLSDAMPIPMFPDESTAFRSVRGYNIGATHQPSERPHVGAAGRSSIWFSLRPRRGGFVSLTTQSTFREVVAVYTGPHVGNLTRVDTARGGPPGGGAGSPADTEDVNGGLWFRVQRGVRYAVAVDSRQAGVTGGVRVFLDYSSARPDVRPTRRVVAPGRRPVLRLQIRNTSRFERVRVYNVLEGDRSANLLDCPNTFVVRPEQSRTCRVRTPVTGAAGERIKGRIWAWLEWPESGHFSTISDTWSARVRS